MVVPRHAPVAEESLASLWTVDGEGHVFSAVRAEPSAIFELVLTLERLVLEPDAPIPITLLVECDGFLCKSGRSQQKKS